MHLPQKYEIVKMTAVNDSNAGWMVLSLRPSF